MALITDIKKFIVKALCLCGNAEATVIHGTKGNCCPECARN
jgi:hypothetical protein